MQVQEYFKLFADCMIAAKNEPELTGAACLSMDKLLTNFILTSKDSSPDCQSADVSAAIDSNKIKFEKVEEIVNSLDLSKASYDKKREIIGIKTLLMLTKIASDPLNKDIHINNFADFMAKLRV